jgi:hypothetical protein
MILLALLGFAMTSGCDGNNPVLSNPQAEQPPQTAEKVLAGNLNIYGGAKNNVFLGCLSCPSTDTKSVLNKYGSYGSKYSSTSIFNAYGQYGGAYGTYSPCNKSSNTPPGVWDRDGLFYGYLTVNKYVSNRITDTKINAWLQTSVCGGK